MAKKEENEVKTEVVIWVKERLENKINYMIETRDVTILQVVEMCGYYTQDREWLRDSKQGEYCWLIIYKENN